MATCSIDCHASQIFKFTDHDLQPHTKALPSYVHDNRFHKKKLEAVKDKSKDSILVYLEVQALYTNSLNHEGIEGVKETLNHQAS